MDSGIAHPIDSAETPNFRAGTENLSRIGSSFVIAGLLPMDTDFSLKGITHRIYTGERYLESNLWKMT
ncbi:MAG: hypothetical protein LVR00_08250 [Rhabdochlamydiaceae bacterium]|jgi:hypothetical protein